jgi:hypothetical protein
MGKSDLLTIPGIGNTFVEDFARIGIDSINELIDRDPEELFEALKLANAAVDHKTSKNYLYVLRIAVYYANGGRNPEKLKWNAWKNT